LWTPSCFNHRFQRGFGRQTVDLVGVFETAEQHLLAICAWGVVVEGAREKEREKKRQEEEVEAGKEEGRR